MIDSSNSKLARAVALLKRSRYGRLLRSMLKGLQGQGQLAPAIADGEMAKTILIADDDPNIREILCRMFEAEGDYDICAEASNGRETIDLALKRRPELIILDLSMPVMNGLEASNRVEKDNARRPDNSV
jgi:PleD family two-component response regulator